MKKLTAVCLTLLMIAINVAACTNAPIRNDRANVPQLVAVPAVTENPTPPAQEPVQTDDMLKPTRSDFEYEDNGDGTCTITGYTGAKTGDLNIPGEINGLKVTAIGDMAFYYCDSFTGSLTIPEGVTIIGNSAFWKCTGFTGTLTIPESVTTIEGWAFNHCKGLTGTLIIPDNVTSIGREAFAHNSFTGTLTIPESVITIENRAFVGCSKLTQVEFLGNAPANFGGSIFCVGEKCPFTKCLEVIYDPEKSGWSTPKWNEYNAYPKS